MIELDNMADLIKPLNEYGPLTLKDIFSDDVVYHDPAKDIAEHATSLLLGQGYSVDILRNDQIDKELSEKWQKIERFNKFGKMIERNEYDLSIYGSKVITIDYHDGNVILMENDPRYFSKVSTFQQISEISAVIYKKVVVDITAFICKELWDDEKVVREWYVNDEKVILENLQVELPKELRLPSVWYHNLGILPLKLMVNKNRNITYINEYYQLSDTATCKVQISALNLYANQQIKEAVINTTKIFGEYPPDKLKQLKKSMGNTAGVELLLAQMLIGVKKTEASGGKPVEILSANPAFEKYILAKQDQLKHIWRAAGYTYMTGDESTSSNAETLYANAFDIRTTKKKKTTRQDDYADIVAKSLIASGAITKEEYFDGTIQVIFNIKENAVQTPNQITDNEIKLVDAGFKSKARALMKIEQLPNIEQAQEWVDEATEELDEAAEKQYQLLDDNGMVESGGNDKMTASIEPRGENA